MFYENFLIAKYFLHTSLKKPTIKSGVYTYENKGREKIKGRRKLDRLVINIRLSQPLRIIQNHSTEYLLLFKSVYRHKF